MNCKVEYYEYKSRIRNLNVEAQGEVKSQKYFPVFLNNGVEEIFKPISKTKPLATPFFAYSEVFWSNMINRFFDSNTPIYRLAICENYSNEVPKYNNHGVIVPSIIKSDEKLVNLLEFFRENNDPSVDIDKYINFCMKTYDYTPIFNSAFFRENQQFGNQLAKHVLISILKADQNYHYENVSLIFKNNKAISIAPMIDHEFSSMFLYLENIELNQSVVDRFLIFNKKLESDNLIDKAFFELKKEMYPIIKNIELIVERYEDVVLQFLDSLEMFLNFLENNEIKLTDEGYLYPFNSNNYEAGILEYKENNPLLAKELLASLPQYTVDIKEASLNIQKTTIYVAKSLKKYLNDCLEIKHSKSLTYKN